MGIEQKSQKENNTLKNMNFLAWRVSKTKEKQQRKDVNRILFERDRQRSTTQH